jgi:hypothetical protein
MLTKKKKSLSFFSREWNSIIQHMS